MPNIGDVVRAADLGRSGYQKYLWHACIDCGKPRWVQMRHGQPSLLRCQLCGKRKAAKTRMGDPPRRANHAMWNGGRRITSDGYVSLTLELDDPMACMATKRGRVYEHRLVMARFLGRPLTADEVVHHRDRNRQNNEISNLQLMSKADHSQHHVKRLAELEAEVEKLKALLAER